MAVRTAQLGIFNTPAESSGTTLYTCPAGKTVIVKTVHAASAAGSHRVRLDVVGNGNVLSGVFFDETVDAATTARADGLFIVLEPTDRIRCTTTGEPSGSVRTGLHGAILDGVA